MLTKTKGTDALSCEWLWLKSMRHIITVRNNSMQVCCEYLHTSDACSRLLEKAVQRSQVPPTSNSQSMILLVKRTHKQKPGGVRHSNSTVPTTTSNMALPCLLYLPPLIRLPALQPPISSPQPHLSPSWPALIHPLFRKSALIHLLLPPSQT
jgi:hypothetical protein